MTKKKLVVISGIISVVMLIINYFGVYSTCVNIFECTEILFGVMMIFFPVIPLFIFSIITYFMQVEVFNAWWRFSKIWIPLSMLAILISPSYTSNWMFPIEKGAVAFFTSALFVIISILVVIYKNLQLRKK